MNNSIMSLPKINITRIALAALIIGAMALGFAPIFVRLSETGPVATGLWRLFFVLPAFLTRLVDPYLGSALLSNLVEGVMRLYRSQGKGTDALAAFARLETALKQNLNIAPSKVLQQLAADIRTDLDGAPSG